MSTTIDQRVVEMRFDNKHFESNVSTTMSTLDKLKQKLNLSGASKGLENINASAKKVDMNGLARGVETVSARFSAMDVIGVTALANITNSAVNAGKRMVSALTIDPIKTGFQEYETQINSVQTILSNTKSKGSTIDDVNKALEELNLYADKTIYNFTEMTRNIGTFTAAGVELDTSVNAIQGIANLAAMSGSTSQQASTAMYQLSQALAAGKVQLMDWNSVVNAGMGGEMFQNALRKTSELLGTGAEAAIKAKGSFRESLREGWLTSEVLTETLKKFTTTGANEYIAEYTGLTLDAVNAETERIKTAKDSKKAMEEVAESLAKASGKSKDEIYQILEFAQDAEDAATKVKTFTQLWDVMKESAQSGWSQTWKLIVGDFEEAKELLTPLADTLTGFINKMSNARNFVVEGVMDFAAPWTALTEKLGKVQEVAKSVTKVTDKLEHFQKVVNDVWRGDYKNSDTGRFELLEKAGYDHRVVQDLVNKGREYKLTMEDIEASHKKFGLTMETTTEETKAVTEALSGLDDETLRNAGLTEEEIRLYRDLEKGAKEYGMTMDELAKKMSETSGRDLLISSFKNIGSAIVNVFKAIGNAWGEIFEPASIVNIYMMLDKFHEWTKTLQLVDKETGELNETGQKIQRTFKGIFAIVDILATILGGGLRIAVKVITSVLEYFGLNILDVTAYIGDAAVKVRDWFDSLFDVSGLLDKIGPTIKSVKKWFESLADLPGVQHLVNSVTKLMNGLRSMNVSPLSALVFVFDRITGAIKHLTGIDIRGFFSSMVKSIVSAIENLTGIDLSGVGKNIFDGLTEGLGDGAKNVINTIAEAAAKLIDKFCEILGIHSPSKVFIAIGGFIITGLILGIKEGLITVPESIQDIVDKCVEVIQNVDWGTIMALGISVASLMFIKKIGDALSNLSSPFGAIGELLESVTKVTNAAAFNINMKAIKNLAIAIAILAGAIIIFINFCGDDYVKMWNAVGIITVLAVVLAGIAIAMTHLSKASVTFEKGKFDMSGMTANLLSIGLAIAAVALVVKMLGKMDSTEAEAGFKRLAGIAVGMVIFIGACQLITKNGNSDNVSKIGGMMIKLTIALALMVGVCKLIAKLSLGEMLKGAAFVTVFGIFTIALIKVAKSSGNNVSKVGGMVVKIAFALGLMVGVCKLVNLLSVGEMIKGGIFALAFAGFVKLLIHVTKIGKKQQIAKLGGLILSISLSMTLMVGVCKLVGKLSLGEMLKGAAFAVGFGLLVAALVNVLKIANDTQIAKVSGTVLAISIAIGILAAVSMLLSLMSLESLAKGVAAVSILGFIMSIMIKSLKGAQNVVGSLIVMTIAIAVLAAAAASLTLIPDTAKLLASVGSISLMMYTFSTMIKSLKGLKVSVSAIVSLSILTLVVGAIAIIIYRLRDIDPMSALGNTTALSVLMLAMSGCLLILSKVSTTIGKAMIGVLALSAMVIPMGLFIGALAVMSLVSNATTNAKALIGLMTTMTLLLVPLCIIGAIVCSGVGAGFIIAGIAALAAMVIPMGLFIGALAVMSCIKNADTNANLLINLMTTMADLLIKISLVAPLALMGVSAMAGLTLLMVAIGGLAIGIGYLMEKVPDLQRFLDTGLPVLEQLAGSIGTMVGKFIGGIGEGIGDSLVKIGEDITAFMKSLQEASEHAKGIEGSSFDGVKQLLEALIGVGLASVGMSVADVFTNALGDQTAMEKFQNDGVAFFKAIKEISKEMVGFALPKDFSSEAIISLLDVLKKVGSSMVGVSFADLFTTGDQTAMEKFEVDGVAFFKAVKEISKEMVGFTFPEDFSVEGLKKLLEALKSVGSSMMGVSFADLFTTGDQTAMEKFKVDGVAFFSAIKEISKEMVGFALPDDFSPKAITSLLDVIKSVGSATVGISFADLFTAGDQTAMEKFKVDGVAFFKAIKEISSEMTGFVLPKDFSSDAILSLIEVIKNIGTSMMGVSWADLFTWGEGTTMDKFQTDGVALFKAIKAISSEASGITTGTFSAAETAVADIKRIIEKTKGIDYSGVEKFTGIGTGGIGADGPMHDIGAAIKDFGEEVNGINVTAITTSVTAATKIKSLIASLVNLDTSGIDNFKVKAIGTAMKDYNSQIKNIDASVVASSVSSAKKLVSLITSLVGLDTSGISAFNVKSIGDKMKAYSNSVADLNTGAISNSINAANRLKSFINSLSGLDTSGVGSFKSAVENLGKTQVGDIEKVFKSASANLSKVGTGLIDGLTKGMKSRQGSLINTSSSMVKHLVNNVRKSVSAFRSAGVALMSKLATGLLSQRGRVVSAVSKPLSSAVTTARGYYTSFYSAGSYLVSGFAAGISANTFRAEAKAAAMAEAAYEAAREELDINSPSKVFRALGYSVSEGFAMGIDKLSGMAKGSAVSMADSAIEGVKKSVSYIAGIIDSDLDPQPTIRPILDLSDVRSGAATIGGMFGNGASVGVMANVRSISSMMNGRNQNGSNGDVVDAINKLRSDIGNIKGDTYSINGMTYDDGSNITEAVRTIARRALIERRI